MSRVRVLLADDHRIVAEGLKSLLVPEFDLIGVVEDGRAMVESTKALKPDVIVADITMPHLNGIEALEEVRKFDRNVRVIFLTMHRDIAYAYRAIEAGAAGYVLKHSAPEELALAVRAAAQGRVFITPDLAGEMLRTQKRNPHEAQDPVATLTLRHDTVLDREVNQIAFSLEAERLSPCDIYGPRRFESKCVALSRFGVR